MRTLLLVKWAARDLVRRPLTWVAAVTLSGLWLFLLVLSPIGITTRGASAEAQAQEVAFLGLLVGSSLALSQLRECRFIFGRSTWVRRNVSRLAILATGATVMLVVSTCAPVLAARGTSADVWLPVITGALPCLIHLCVLGLIISEARLPEGARSLSLPILAWVMPGLVSDRGLAGSLAHLLLDASRHLSPVSGDYSVLASGIAPILGLLCVVAILDPPPQRTP